MSNAPHKSLAEIDSFITLLCVACEDSDIYQQLEKILSLPNENRQFLLRSLVADMQNKGASPDFIAAIASLIDTEVSERAYEVIFNCQRQIPL